MGGGCVAFRLFLGRVARMEWIVMGRDIRAERARALRRTWPPALRVLPLRWRWRWLSVLGGGGMVGG